MKVLLVATLLLLNDVRHDAGHGLEACHSHGQRVRGAERRAKHGLKGLQEWNDCLVADFE